MSFVQALGIGEVMRSVRWDIVVPPKLDQSVRLFIPTQGGASEGDLSHLVEEAVRSYLLEKTVEQAKTTVADMSESELTGLIDEAVQWSRDVRP